MTQNFSITSKVTGHKDSNEIILMIKALKNRNICDLENVLEIIKIKMS